MNNKPYLIIKDKDGKLVGKRPTEDEPNTDDCRNQRQWDDWNKEWQDHLKQLPSLHLDPSIKGKEGDRVEGREVEQVLLSYGQGSTWYGLDEVDVINFDSDVLWKANRRITLKAVAEKEPERKPLRLEDFPHLVEMKKEIERLVPGTVAYWKQRCINREKMDDPTYSDFERSNCRYFYIILVKKIR